MRITKEIHAFIWRDYQVNNCNSYLILGKKNVLIDPGHLQLFDHVRSQLLELDISLDRIGLVMVTHGHSDHLEGAKIFEGTTPVALGLVESDYLANNSIGRAEMFEPDIFLKDGEIAAGDIHLRVIPTPGHTPGSVCIYWPARKALFSGDVIFRQGIGRTDLPGGNGKSLKESIEKLSMLEVDYLLPGHGEIVVGKEEIRANFKELEQMWIRYLG